MIDVCFVNVEVLNEDEDARDDVEENEVAATFSKLLLLSFGSALPVNVVSVTDGGNTDSYEAICYVIKCFFKFVVDPPLIQ